MSWVRSLIEALNPCIHQWEVVEKLKDRPKNPRTVILVRECIVCGEIDCDTLEAPDPPPTCPPHKWVTERERKLFNGCKTTEGALPIALAHEQRCAECGDVRVVRLDWNRV